MPRLESSIYRGGNIENKYQSNNIIAKMLMNKFHKTLLSFITQVAPSSIYEVGCGEGYLTRFIAKSGYTVTGSDLYGEVITHARSLSDPDQLSSGQINFEQQNIYELDEKKHRANLVICCEVLEHLTDPHIALERLASIADPYVIMSVPREPLWRFMNCCRGKYLSNLGNTPGHIQHWDKNSFCKFISKKFDIIEIASPLPWTMILGKVRQ